MIEAKIEVYDFDKPLKVGIISDSQLSPVHAKKYTVFEDNLIKALGFFKNAGCNFIMFAGDICNAAGKRAYERLNSAIELVYGSDRPLFQFIMGNHDYYGTAHFNSPEYYRSLFQKCVGQNPYTHYVVNGFHFIGVSPYNSSMTRGNDEITDWIREQIDIAVSQSGEKPVFVMTHNSPENTVYGSDDWGDKTIGNIFRDYPQVVNISGHTHYSLLDERCFWVGDYTAIGTQSVSYTEMEGGKQNGTVPPASYKTPMGYILDFEDESIAVRRYNFTTKREEKADHVNRIPYKISSKNDLAKAVVFCKKPKMTDEYGRYELRQDGTHICFSAGSDEDFVHSYKLVFSDESQQLYFTDFYNGIAEMKKNVDIKIIGKKGKFDIKVYAINSSGMVSDNFTIIKNVIISKKADYKKVYTPEMKI